MSNFDNKNCPLCGEESRSAFVIDGFELRDCLSCDHRFLPIEMNKSHADSVYGDEYFTSGGAGYADYTKRRKMLISRGEYFAEKLIKHGQPGRLLDVGAAAGFIARGYENAGWEVVGIEPNASMVDFGKRELGLDLRQGALETTAFSDNFDAVSIIQVAAHFFDPKKAFEKAYSILNEGGLLVIETWDRSSISARIFGESWHEYSPPSVVHWFSKKGLRAFVEGIGFEHIETGRPTKKISGEHAKSLLTYKFGDRAFWKLIPSGVNFPYPSEDLFYSIFRKR